MQEKLYFCAVLKQRAIEIFMIYTRKMAFIHPMYLLLLLFLTSFSGCERQRQQEMTPWGTPVDSETGAPLSPVIHRDSVATLSQIQSSGEMILLTQSGPETYFDYHGRGMGIQYLLCEKFAQKLGVSLRVELCKDSAELMRRLEDGEGDIVAFPLPPSPHEGDVFETLNWHVKDVKSELADSITRWFRPDYIALVRSESTHLLSSQSVTRHVYSPMLNRKGGIISHYDHLFRQYAPVARWDWRLLAALCYQESTFDPKAHSWAGACGLMQIMPSTAAHLGLPLSQIYNPEQNIAAAARYIHELSGKFSDVGNASERYNFVLASYNGGFFHIRDAMALARKNGKNPYRWADVSEYVLKLSQPQYYNDPVVKNGYMRGSETVDYVSRIRDRWAQYRGFARPSLSGEGSTGTPQKAKKEHRFKL